MSNEKDFVIKNGVLEEYIGKDTNVIIPEGITEIGERAFADLEEIISISIPESVATIGAGAFNWCASLTNITLPKSITTIGAYAFGWCKSLTSISIPESVTRIENNTFEQCISLTSVSFSSKITNIGSYAFYNCQMLRTLDFPEQLTTIGNKAFYGCESINDLVLPDSLSSLGIAAFSHATNLKSVVFPKNLTQIAVEAFSDCINLKAVKLPHNLKEIFNRAFGNCENIEFEVPEELAEKKTIFPIILSNYTLTGTTKALAYIVLYQRGVCWNKWRDAKEFENPSAIFEFMIDILQDDEATLSKTDSIVAAYISKYYSKIPPATIERMLSLYKKIKSKEIKELYDFRLLMIHMGRESADDPKANEANKIIEQIVAHPDVLTAIKKGIHWKDSSEICHRDVLIGLLSYYANEYYRCEKKINGEMGYISMLGNGANVNNSDSIDKLADMLNKDELSALVTKLVKGVKYRPFILSWARFAKDEDIQAFTSQYKKLKRGKSKERYLAENLKQALIISQTRTAMLFFDEIEELSTYANARGMTCMELRDTLMMPDFGFDKDGVKRYDVGGNTIEITVNKDLSLSLFDVKNQKIIKSFPKKSDNLKKAETAAKDFSDFKKKIKSFIILKSEQLIKMHITGESLKNELWAEVYLGNPIIKNLSEYVIWKDETGKTFIVINGKIIECNENTYVPQDNIHVAHVLEMKPEEINNWQKLLVSKGQSQLFEQIWEPVFSISTDKISTAYNGIIISSKERNELKKNLKRCGINVRSGEMDREFVADYWEYEFSNENTMYFGKSLQIEYTVLDDNSIQFKNAKINEKYNDRELNGILLELEKVVVRSHIQNNKTECLNEIILDCFSASQISGFIEYSVESKATDCTAYLMDYKNRKYPDYSSFDAFILEW